MAKSKFPSGVVFIIVVGAFASWTYFSQYKGKERARNEKEAAQALLPFSNGDVTEIILDGKFTVKKTDGEWRLTSPITDLADPIAVDSFLSSLSTEKSKGDVVGGEGSAGVPVDWKTFGLEGAKPNLTVVAGDRKRTLQIGTLKAYDGSLYARLDGSESVVLLSAAIEAPLGRSDREMRDKRFFPRSSKEKAPVATEIQIEKAAGAGFKLLKGADGAWSLVGANDLWPLDQSKARELVDTAVGLRGSDIWGEDKSDRRVLQSRKLDRPAITVRLKTESSEMLEIRLAPTEKDQSLTAGMGSARPQIFAVYKAQVDDLSKSVEALYDKKKPFSFNTADVVSVEFKSNGLRVPLAVVKEKTGWSLDPLDGKSKSFDLDGTAVDGMLSAFAGLSVDKVLPVSAAKSLSSGVLGAPGAVEIKLFGEGKKILGEWSFVPRDLKAGSASSHYDAMSSLIRGRPFTIARDAFDGLGLEKLLKSRSVDPKGNPATNSAGPGAEPKPSPTGK